MTEVVGLMENLYLFDSVFRQKKLTIEAALAFCKHVLSYYLFHLYFILIHMKSLSFLFSCSPSLCSPVYLNEVDLVPCFLSAVRFFMYNYPQVDINTHFENFYCQAAFVNASHHLVL